MQVSKVKERLARLPSAGGLLNKVSAVLRPASVASVSEQTRESQSTETMRECMARRLELELTRTQAEELAYRVRQRAM